MTDICCMVNERKYKSLMKWLEKNTYVVHGVVSPDNYPTEVNLFDGFYGIKKALLQVSPFNERGEIHLHVKDMGVEPLSIRSFKKICLERFGFKKKSDELKRLVDKAFTSLKLKHDITYSVNEPVFGRIMVSFVFPKCYNKPFDFYKWEVLERVNATFLEQSSGYYFPIYNFTHKTIDDQFTLQISY